MIRYSATINVESFEPDAFTHSDLQFLEIFARDVAFALKHVGTARCAKSEHGAAEL